MCSAYDATVSSEDDYIIVGNRRFQFIGKFCGGGHFSGTVVEVLRGGKSKCKFCDGYDYKYTLSDHQDTESKL